MRPSHYLLAALILLCVACGQAGPAKEAALNPPGFDAEAAWSELERNPGVPGQDYLANRILVSYRADPAPPVDSIGGGELQGESAAAERPNPQLRQHKQYEPLTEAIANRYGLSIAEQVYLGRIRFASFEVPAGVDSAALLQRIRSEQSAVVEHAVYVPLRRAQFVPDDPDFAEGATGAQWSHWTIGCPQVWDTTLGSSEVIVAVVDTGVTLTHEELAGTVINPQVEFPWADCDLYNPDQAIEDTDGHGTFLAGMVCAAANNGRTITGVAPGCRVLPIKAAESRMEGYLDKLIAGSLLAGQLGAQVVSYSWGAYEGHPLEEDMVNQLTEDGVLFVCAAGNDGISDNIYPANYTNSLGVGATNMTETKTWFTNWGSAVDIAAPGEGIKGCRHDDDSGYFQQWGTSISTPMVAAAAALLWSYRPELTLAQVRDALVSNGPEIGGFSGTVRRLDIAAALDEVFIHIYPSAAGTTQQGQATLGTVVGKPVLNANLVGAQNVVRAIYTLDLAPEGAGPEDVVAESIISPAFPAPFSLAGLTNQTATLHVEIVSSTNDSAEFSVGPLWICNQRGDIDGDGGVTESDLAALVPLIGLRSYEAGFLGYADADADGRITEADASAIGYSFDGN